MTPILFSLLQFVFILLLAPLTIGLIRWFKARLQGRKGASPLLMYYSLLTLMKKEMVISKSVSWVFRLVPFIVLTSALFLALVFPIFAADSFFASLGNLFVVSSVLMLGAVFLVLGGLDSASAFGGMGAEREMTIAALIEPAIIVTLSGFVVASETLPQNLANMIAPGLSTILVSPYLLFSFFALVLILLAENARYPVDNPATHLELTMVHEAMILEYSGPYLAMLEYASAIKLTVFLLFLGNLVVFPFGFLIIKLIIGALLIALVESLLAKMRFYRMQEYLSGAFFLGLVGLILAVIHQTL